MYIKHFYFIICIKRVVFYSKEADEVFKNPSG